MEPVMDALTRSIKPARRATPAMISSARFPIVALRTPPMAGLVCSATTSVAAPRTPESGMMAIALRMKTAIGDAPASLAMSAIGTNKSSAYRILIAGALLSRAGSARSKQVAQRDVHRRLAGGGRETSKSPRNVERESAGLQAETESRARTCPPVVPDVSGAEVHLPLVRHVRAEAHRVPSERSRVDEATRGAKLRVLYVVIDEFEPVHRAELDLRGQWIALVGFSGVDLSPQIPDGCAERKRRAELDVVLGAKIDRA